MEIHRPAPYGCTCYLGTQMDEPDRIDSACPHHGRQRQRAYGGTAAAKRNVTCQCDHPASNHEGDEYGFCLVCDCNHYRPVIRSTA